MSNSFVTPCTASHQAPLSMEFSRQEYWSGVPFPSPGWVATVVGVIKGSNITWQVNVSDNIHRMSLTGLDASYKVESGSVFPPRSSLFLLA